jgi:hypothetical protein
MHVSLNGGASLGVAVAVAEAEVDNLAGMPAAPGFAGVFDAAGFVFLVCFFVFLIGHVRM